MKFLAYVFLIILFMPFQSSAIDCPKIPEQTNKEWDVEVKAAVGKIGPVKGAELETRTKKATLDLMGKLPQADKVYLEQMMYATYCPCATTKRCQNLKRPPGFGPTILR